MHEIKKPTFFFSQNKNKIVAPTRGYSKPISNHQMYDKYLVRFTQAQINHLIFPHQYTSTDQSTFFCVCEKGRALRISAFY